VRRRIVPQGGVLVKELVEYIAKSLVDDPSQVEVTEFRRGGSVILKLQVAQEDKGRVIGRNGRVANAMRSVLRVMGARQGKRVNLDIV
jgi:predicted RNA-binding protein YlqC (UPF0109 family)